MEFGDLIKARRLEINKTLEEVGKAVGVSKTAVQRWESGEIKDMRRDKLVSLARALNTTPAYLMGWNSETAATNSKAGLDERWAMFEALPEEAKKRVEEYMRFEA